MGFTQIRRDKIRHILCDTIADIKTIPTNYAPGSQLFCIEDGNRYVLNTSKVWSKVNRRGGGTSSGGGETTEAEFMTEAEVDAMFD